MLRERLGTIGGRALLTSSARSLVLSLVMAFAVAAVVAEIGTGYGIGGWIRLLIAVATGAAVYLGTAGIAGTVHGWQTSRRGARAHSGPVKGNRETYPYRH